MKNWIGLLVLTAVVVGVVAHAGHQDSITERAPFASKLEAEVTGRGHSALSLSVPPGWEVREIRIRWGKQVGDKFLDDCLDWVGGEHDVPTYLTEDDDGWTTVVRTHTGRPLPTGEWSVTLKWLGGLGPSMIDYDLVEVRKEVD